MFTICLQFSHTLLTTDLYNVLKDKGKEVLKESIKGIRNMKKYIELNNRTFEVKKVKRELHPLGYKTLADCYKKPSDIKRSIWSQWVEWIVQLKSSTNMWFGSLVVVSYNCMMFTLGCNVYNNDNELIGYLYITKTRQELWLA